MRLLVTSMGSTAAQNLVRFVRRRREDWFVVGADAQHRHGGLGLADRDVAIPRGDSGDYVDELISVASEAEADLVVPVMEPELRSAAPERDRIAEASGADVLVSAPETIATCESKRRTAKLFNRLGVDTPAILSPDDTLDFPVFVRPESGQGSRGAHRVPNRDFLEYYLDEDPSAVVTEYVPGREFSIDGFVDQHGDLLHAVCRERKDVRHGLSVQSQVVELGSRRETVAEIVEEVGVFGFFNLQFRRTDAGREVYFDLNPRLGGAMALSFEAGLDPIRLVEGLFEPERHDEPFETDVGLELFRRWENLYLDGA